MRPENPDAGRVLPDHQTSRLGVLVVDDEKAIVQQLADGLRLSGYRVATAGNALAALAHLDEDRSIGLLLSDVRMPGCDGLSLANKLLATRTEDEAVEVVLITGHATIDDAAAAIRARVCDFLRKPFRLKEAATAVEAGLTRARLRRDVAAAQEKDRAAVAAMEAEIQQLKASLQVRMLANVADLARTTGTATPQPADLRAMSHALRTPLNAIAGGTDLLIAGVTEGGAQQSYLRLLQHGVRDAVEAVELVEEWHRLAERGMTRRRVMPAALLRGLAERLAAGADAERRVLRIGAVEDAELLCDEGLLKRTVELVLTAALAVTRPGGIVDVTARRLFHARQGWWLLTCCVLRDAEAAAPPLPEEPVLHPMGTPLSRGYETLRFCVARRAADQLGGFLSAASQAAGGAAIRLALPRPPGP